MKTVMNTFALRSIRAAVMVGLLGNISANAQEYTPDIKAALIASPESGKTLELKDGRVFTYRQLVELPEPERKTILRLYKNRSENIDFREWELAAVEASADEARKAAQAKIAKMYGELATNIRTVLASGAKLNIRFSTFSESVTTIRDDHLKAGLSKEDADFLRSLLKRPELFAQP